MTALDWSRHPLVLAPMAGGPSTVALATAAAGAGMFAFLAGAYLSPTRLREDVLAFRARTDAPFGVNIFAPSDDGPSMRAAATAYAELLAPWAAAAGVALGEPRYDDDAFAAKVDLLAELRPALVSFAFAWPPADAVTRLQTAGVEVWVTLNEPDELDWAVELGVDGVVLQGWEAGGHRGGPHDSGRPQPAVSALLAQVIGRPRGTGRLGVLAAGGVQTGGRAAQLLAAGADAVAFGTAFLACPEAGTAPVHVHELTRRDETTVTRAFTGRSARALVSTWTRLFSDAAPAAYPHVNHLTAPLRAHGKATGEAELVHLWAGQGHAEVRALPAAELAQALYAELRAASSPGRPDGSG